jgi:hypothetical protein
MSHKKKTDLSATQYITLHCLWWILGWAFAVFGNRVYTFYNYLLNTPMPVLSFIVLFLAFETLIIGPMLEYVYYRFSKYSVSSLTSLVMICFVLAISTIFFPFVVLVYAFTPLLPLLFESLTPITKVSYLKQRIRIEFKLSLFSYSIIDISLVAIEFVLFQLKLFR